jgi:hypothetical protein
MARNPPFTLEIEAPANGRVRKATVTVLDAEGNVMTTDRGDLQSEDERRKLASRLAKKLQREPGELQGPLEEKWNETLTRHRRMREQAVGGSPEAAPQVTVELLDAQPEAVRRPLCLAAGHAYAATWLPVRRTVSRSVDRESGALTIHTPPLVTVEDTLLVVRDDGQLYTDAPDLGAAPLAELGLLVRLPFVPPPDRCWSGAGVKRFLAGERPEPADVFWRVVSVVDAFIDFSRSLAPQTTLCEMAACYALATYFLDALYVIGYLWPNGEPGSGKTSFLQVEVELSYLGHLILSGSSYACLRDLADYGATLAFDDAENVMDVKRVDPDKRTLLLAGNRKGASVAVKELDGERWVTRHVNTFCPRLFSAIRLPDQVLSSRSIVTPLIRSGDQKRTKANVLDRVQWPCDRRRLVDDLWALGLANLRDLPEHDRQAAALATQAGRNFEPWRAILAVAHWLQERHGVEGLFTRLEKLSVDYQKERAEFEEGDRTRVLFRALLVLTRDAPQREPLDIAPTKIAEEMLNIAAADDLAEEGKEFTNARKVGWLLKRQRFTKGDRSEQGVTWRISRAEVEAGARAYGLDPKDSANREPAPERQGSKVWNVRCPEKAGAVDPADDEDPPF